METTERKQAKAAEPKPKMVFEELNAINVNGHTDTKVTDGGRTKLTYLSWPWAWAEVKKRYPTAKYEVVKFDGIPYIVTPLGIMVYTNVTINDTTHEMWLPVMDSTNKAMKAEPYEYMTKYGTKTVNAATMFDINKTIMRCLVKNLAMFGLGLYIYAGEDLPEESDEVQPQKKPDAKVKQSKGLDAWNKYKSSADPSLTADQVKEGFAKLMLELTGKSHSKDVTDAEWDKVLDFMKAA